MIRFLSLFVSIFLVSQAHASDVSSVVENISSDKPVAEIITYEVKKEILPLPTCDDNKLIEKTREFIKEYYSKSNDNSVVHRRKKHFVLNNLNKFTKENVANYKTESTRPVSDVIAELKVNEKIIEENILLCKNTSKDKYASNIYLLAHPYKKGYKVFLLNLDDKVRDVFFEYE